jgi:DNA repair exonuclease SbcCD ATPase subunit
MLTLKRLKVRKVLIFDSVDLMLDRSKITVIHGLNRLSKKSDTNGVGKSLLLNIIQKILFNQRLNDIVKQGSELELEFYNHHEYVVNITYKSGIKYGIKIDGVDQQTHTIASARSIIDDAVGISIAEYQSLFHLSGDSPNSILRGSNSARLEFFTSFFNLGMYERLRNNFRLKLKTLNNLDIELKTLVSELKDIKEEIASLVRPDTKKIALYTEKIVKFESLEKELNKLNMVFNITSQIENLRSLMSGKRFDLKELLRLDRSIVAANEVKDKRKQILTRLTVYKKQKKEIVDELNILTVDNDLEGEINEIKRKIVTLDAKIKRQEADNLLFKSLTLKLKEYGIDRSKFIPSLFKRANDELSIYSSTMSLYSKLDSSKCSVCGTEFDVEKLEANVKLAKRKSANIKLYIEAYTVHEELKTVKFANVDKLIGIYNKYVGKLSSLEGQQKLYEKSLHLKEDLKQIEAMIKKLTLSLPELLDQPNIDIDTVRSDIETARNDERIQSKLKTLKLQMSDLSVKEIKSDLIKDRITEIEQSFFDLKQEISDLAKIKRDYDIYSARYNLLVSKGKAIKVKIDDLKLQLQDKDVVEALIAAYSSKGLKIKKVQSIANMLTSNLNKYRELLFYEDLKFEIVIDESKFDILVQSKNSRSDVRDMSKSEGNRFNLLLMLSLLPMAKSRMNNIMLDEMDSGFSEVNKEMFRSKFIPMLRNVVPNIIIATPDTCAYPGSVELIVSKGVDGKSTLINGIR